MKLFIIFALAIASPTTGLHLPKEKLGEKLPLKTKHEGRIVGGQVADIQQFNYQVGLELHNSTGAIWCGGSILSPNWVLTAAHCTHGRDLIIASFGRTIRTHADVEYVIVRSYDNVIEHEWYSVDNAGNDIALVRIPTLDYSKNIGPVILPIPDRQGIPPSLAGRYGTASGWGHIHDNDTYPPEFLQSVTLRIISSIECSESYKPRIIAGDRICVATNDDDTVIRSPCSGDSGGPLVLRGTNLQIGVGSFLQRDGFEPGKPAVFTRISYYVDWIRANTGIKV